MPETPGEMHMYDMVKIDTTVFEIMGGGLLKPPPPGSDRVKSCILKPSQDNGAPPLSVIKIVRYCDFWGRGGGALGSAKILHKIMALSSLSLGVGGGAPKSNKKHWRPFSLSLR